MPTWSYAQLYSLVTALLVAICIPIANAGDNVEFKQSDTTLDITIDGQPFATYNFSHELPKPFLMPVRTSAGVVVNRILNDASDADHPHHKGVWNSVDEVNGIKFWKEDGPIRNTSVKVIQSGGPVEFSKR